MTFIDAQGNTMPLIHSRGLTFTEVWTPTHTGGTCTYCSADLHVGVPVLHDDRVGTTKTLCASCAPVPPSHTPSHNNTQENTMSSNNTQSPTSTDSLLTAAHVSGCSTCMQLASLGRKCGTCEPRTYGFSQTPTSTPDVDIELTFDLITPPVETRTHKVGCFITSPDNSIQEATPTEFADAILHVHDMWADDAPVVQGMRRTYKAPEVSNPTTGTVSAYTSETCPVCKRVYSGADISAHLHTHTHEDRQVAHMDTLLTKHDTSVYVANVAQGRQTTYTSESEGLSDTTSLTDAHVREDGMFLTVEVEVSPVSKCKCMYGDVEDNVLVSSSGIDGGTAYKCVHGTQWNEVWEATYTHARWDHLRDVHLQEATMQENSGHFGTNPLYAYLWRQGKTRSDRCEEIVRWVRRAPLKHILLQRKADTLKVRRNLTVAQAVGFDTTPVGKWPGVSGSDICGLVRDTEVTIPYTITTCGGETHNVQQCVQMRRFADWSGIYLTKAQFQHINLLVEKRVKGENLLTPAPKSSHVAVPPTMRAGVAHERTPGDILLRSRMMCATLRQDSIKWDSSHNVPQVSKGVPVYVPVDDVALLSTLGYTQTGLE